MVLDHAMPGGRDFIGAASEATGASVLVCTSDCSEESVLAAMQAGAIGILRKDTLTMEGLAAAVQAAASGAGVVHAELLRRARPLRRRRRKRPQRPRPPGHARPTASSRCWR